MPLKYSKLGGRQTESDIARLMTVALQRPDLLSLAAGFTDNASLPLDEVTRVAAELRARGDFSALQYGPNQGREDLRAILSRRLEAQDGAPEGSCRSENSVLTNGSQQALYLAIQTLCDPGDVVLVEQPTYFVFLEMLRGLGVEAVSMPMTYDGEVDTDGLREQLEAYRKSGDIARVKAVYLVSYFANPSGHSVAEGAKRAIARMLHGLGGQIALIEDAAYRELSYAEPFPAVSCLEAARGLDVAVLYTTTLTKPFATGLKVGFGYCSDADWLARMLAVKGQQDFGSAHYPQALFARIFEKGLFDECLERLRRVYLEKMDALDATLRRELDGLGWSWRRPEGGLYLWLRSPDGQRADFESEFHRSCIEAGVMYVPGDLCHAGGAGRDCVRLSFGVLPLGALAEAGRRFAVAARRLPQTA